MPALPRRRPGRPRRVPLNEQRAAVFTAARRVFARLGLRASTIEEIAREAGVSRQVVYEQFEDKLALFDAVVAATGKEMMAVVGGPPEPGTELDDVTWLRRNLSPGFLFCVEHPEALFLFKEADRARRPVFVRDRLGLVRMYAGALGERIERRGQRPGRLPELVVGMFFAMTDAILTSSWEGAEPDAQALFEVLAQFTGGGLRRLLDSNREVVRRLG